MLLHVKKDISLKATPLSMERFHITEVLAAKYMAKKLKPPPPFAKKKLK